MYSLGKAIGGRRNDRFMTNALLEINASPSLHRPESLYFQLSAEIAY